MMERPLALVTTPWQDLGTHTYASRYQDHKARRGSGTGSEESCLVLKAGRAWEKLIYLEAPR